MIRKFTKLRYLLVIVLLVNATMALAQTEETPRKTSLAEETEISTVITPSNKNAIFDAVAKYTFEVRNPTDDDQEGRITYSVFDENGVKMSTDSVKVNVAKKSIGKYNFDIAGKGPGFYKVNFLINTSDYDDTLHKVFGVKPELIRSDYKTPPDFDAFWQKAKEDLAKINPKFTTTFMPGMSTKTCNVYLVQMQSLENITIRGWLTEPVSADLKKKFSIVLALPGYQIDLPPIMTVDPDFAFLALNVRGQGNSREFINTRHDEFVIHHIDDKNKYVMRGVIMDCIRAMDFIYTRPELRHDNIFVKGGSMGGFLAITTAALDNRVNLCSAQSPVFADVRSLIRRVTFPIKSIDIYLKTQPGLTLDQVMNNMDYFDVKNFAPRVKCNFMMSIGLLDTYVPPTNDFAVFNSMTAKKKIMIFRDRGHDVSPVYTLTELKWMHDQFGLYY